MVGVSTVIVGIASVVVLPVMAGPWRLSAVLIGMVVFATATLSSGNPRLFCLWALMAALPMELSKHFGEILFKGGGEQSLRIELYDIFVAVLVLFILRDILRGEIAGPRIPKVTWLWVALMVLGLVTIGRWRVTAMHELVRMAKVLLLFLVLTNEFRTPKRILSCVTPLALGVLLQASVGIAQWVRGDLLGLTILGETTSKTIRNLAVTSVEGQQVFRPSALLLHANILGIFMAVLLPLMIGGLLIKRSPTYRLFMLVTIGAGMAALVLSRARGAWVSFFLAFVVMMFLMLVHGGMRRRSLHVAVAAVVALTIVTVFFSDQIISRLFDSQADASLGRAIYLTDFYRLIAENWFFGVGLNAYAYEIRPYLSHDLSIYRGWVPPVHNIYFLWWGEQGIPGILLHMSMWGSIVWCGIQNLRVKDATLYTLNAASLAAMVAFAFDGLLSFSLRVNQPQRLYFMFAAIIVATYYMRKYPSQMAPGSPATEP